MTHTKLSTSCIIEHAGKILMVREEQEGRIAWDIPAGGLDEGETIYEGVIREVYEESGLSLNNPIHKKVLQYIEKGRTTVNFLFHVELMDKPQIHTLNQDTDEEILDIDWFSREQVKKMIMSSETENNLATARLQSWIEDFENNDFVQVIRE